jgi:hypothetical protein
MTWAYNPKSHRWEALSRGWRALAQRAPNGRDWEAAIEAVEGDARHESPIVFQSSDAARSWCDDSSTSIYPYTGAVDRTDFATWSSTMVSASDLWHRFKLQFPRRASFTLSDCLITPTDPTLIMPFLLLQRRVYGRLA